MEPRSTPFGGTDVPAAGAICNREPACSANGAVPADPPEAITHWSQFPGQGAVTARVFELMAGRGPVFTLDFVRQFWANRVKPIKIFPAADETQISPEHLARRLANSLRIVESGCWEWQRKKHRTGYGLLTVCGGPFFAHRLALILAGAGTERGDHALHACDNRPCINPAHLSFGTHQDNMDDMMERGRHRARGPTVRTDPEYRAGNAKLEVAQVHQIRRLSSGGRSFRSIARELGCSDQTVRLICLGKTWRHVPVESAMPEVTQ